MARDPRSEIEQLFHQYARGVSSYLLARSGDPELAEELTARVFLTVVRRWHQLRGPAGGWLWAIVRTELSRHFRELGRPPPNTASRPPAAPPEELERQETSAGLQQALAKLSEEQQQMVYLKFFLGLRNQEIATITNLTPANVGVRLHRTLKELRELLQTQEARL